MAIFLGLVGALWMVAAVWLVVVAPLTAPAAALINAFGCASVGVAFWGFAALLERLGDLVRAVQSSVQFSRPDLRSELDIDMRTGMPRERV
jgi:hypothetical protein